MWTMETQLLWFETEQGPTGSVLEAISVGFWQRIWLWFCPSPKCKGGCTQRGWIELSGKGTFSSTFRKWHGYHHLLRVIMRIQNRKMKKMQTGKKKIMKKFRVSEKGADTGTVIVKGIIQLKRNLPLCTWS